VFANFPKWNLKWNLKNGWNVNKVGKELLQFLFQGDKSPGGQRKKFEIHRGQIV
jgi:hypothetical protein